MTLNILLKSLNKHNKHQFQYSFCFNSHMRAEVHCSFYRFDGSIASMADDNAWHPLSVMEFVGKEK